MLEIKFQKLIQEGVKLKGMVIQIPPNGKRGRYESVTLFHLGCFAKTAKL